MATWLPHVKLQFGGPIGAGEDEWSNTVRFKVNGDRSGNVGSIFLTGSQLDDALAELEVPLKAWFTGNATGISSDAKLTWAKLNMIGTNGRQSEAQTHQREWTAVTGAFGGSPPPWFVTCALTMRTAYKRGRAHSGRIFPPLIKFQVVAGSPYFSAGEANGAAGAWAAALDAIATAISENSALPNTKSTYAVIASPAATAGPDPGGPVLLDVTGVVVDRVLDVQHRRTNRVPRAEGTTAPVVGNGD